MFWAIFVAETKIIFRYAFVAPSNKVFVIFSFETTPVIIFISADLFSVWGNSNHKDRIFGLISQIEQSKKIYYLFIEYK